jgi:hypothetical protein
METDYKTGSIIEKRDFLYKYKKESIFKKCASIVLHLKC